MDARLRLPIALAALSGLMAVSAGAFAAHVVADPQAKEWLRTGAHYQLTHALAVFACALVGGGKARAAAWLFLAGALIFAGTLYLMAFGAPRVLGAITPIGGLTLMATWALLALAALTRRSGA